MSNIVSEVCITPVYSEPNDRGLMSSTQVDNVTKDPKLVLKKDRPEQFQGPVTFRTRIPVGTTSYQHVQPKLNMLT